MNYRNFNGIRDIQVMMKEAGMYAAGIDGAWGTGSAKAAVSLVSAFYQLMTANTLPSIPASTVPGDAQAQVIVKLQDLLKAAGLYTTKVDGIFGNGTKSGFRKVVDSYIERNRLPRYGHAWSKLVSSEFLAAVVAGCAKRGWPIEAVDWLMACMHFETGGTFSPSIQNRGGAKYFGLIQFGNDAAEDMSNVYKTDITVPKLVAMSQIQQLEWVFKYFDMWTGRGKKITQLEDFYLVIFYPAAVGKKADEVLFTKDSAIPKIAKSYVQNSGFDSNKDGSITVGEISARLYDTYYKGMDTANRVLLAA